VTNVLGRRSGTKRQQGWVAAPATTVVGVNDPIRMLEIRDSPLSVDEIFALVRHSEAGGIALFVGSVRNHDHGKGVDGLNYSAHPSVDETLREVADEVVAAYDVLALAAVHRIGQLGIGDLAVVIGVACPHRGDAFDAARQLIDELKKRVPIWKHQGFVDGSEEWVGTP
jgi:molybdopterin synthase catalytic subunit